jgi:K+-transporting ATPase ATPase C chain
MAPAWLRQHLTALRMMALLTALLGLAYPLVVTGFAQVALSGQANGSLVRLNGHVVGSSLIGQAFSDARGDPLAQWFQPRPSAAGSGYDALASGGSNLGPSNPALVSEIDRRRLQVAAFNHVAPGAVPPDALTASASGLDPDISPAYAYLQVDRVAAANRLPASEVRALVARHVQGRDAGVLGEPVVDVLTLNIALAHLTSGPGH